MSTPRPTSTSRPRSTESPDVPAHDVLPELAGLHRPRLRETTPILWRDGTTISIGERAVVDHVSRAEAAWLAGLDGGRTAAQIESDLTIGAGRARRLLRAALAGAGLEDAAQVPDPVRWARPEDRPVVWGRFGAVVDATGSVDDAARTLVARERISVQVLGEGALADQVRVALGWAGMRLGGATTRGTTGTTVTVVACERPVDLAPADETPPDGPHVPVAVWGRRAVVGPVSGPGLAGCARCRQLHLRDKDPCWPLLAVQWARASRAVAWPPVDPLLSAQAAIAAAHVVRSWADDPDSGGEPQAVEIDLPELVPVRRPRPPHPLCGCRWTQRRP